MKFQLTNPDVMRINVLKLSGVVIGFLFLIFLWSCSSNDLPEVACNNSDLAINATPTNPVDCASKGSVLITATGGVEPYTFALDAGDFSANGTITGVVAGSHIAKVKDRNGCVVLLEVDLVNPSSTLAIQSIDITDSGCKTSQGIISVQAGGGSGSLSYSKDNLDFSNTTGVFSNLSPGTYSIFVKDVEGCIDSDQNVRVTTGVSYLTDIKPILETSCIKSGCHNGDNGASRNWSVFANVQAKAQGIKSLTASGAMPADIAPNGLPQSQRDLIACWVDDGAQNN